MKYLEEFLRNLEKSWKGSLVSVSEVREVEKNAKKFLSLLAKQGKVQRVTWGWYWIPVKYEDFFDFLEKDKHFKLLQKQTAASVWNGDFIHRDYYTIAVRDRSYGRALEKFSQLHGWNVSVETRDFAETDYRKIGKLYVESLEETIVDCLKEWAFADAFSALYENYENVDQKRISEHYWERIPGTNVRVGQVLKFGISLINRETARDLHGSARARIADAFVKRQVEEAAEKVVELG
ncbi:hypothetical protein MYX75_03880 [Acidobacteria bacterium AH-259-A15]|nr:hypothetical protein [Acidobacteria bacterium AH-259-A15]